MCGDANFQLELAYRMVVAAKSLGLTETDRLLIFAFVQKGDGWSSSSISAFTRVPRTTALRHLRKCNLGGIIEYGDRGWKLTDPGRDLLSRTVCQTVQIARGERIGYTTDLIDSLRSMGDFPVTDEAATISFAAIRKLSEKQF